MDMLFRSSVEPMYPFTHRGDLYWLQAIPTEAGRMTLMRQCEGRVSMVIPAPYDLLSSVHEYGGRCFVVVGDDIIFNDRNNGRLHRKRLHDTSEPIALTDHIFEGKHIQYADLAISENGRWLLAVAEIYETNGNENENLIVCVELDNEPPVNTARVRVNRLLDGADFYASPLFSSNGQRIAWIEWNHPNMPWDQSRLMTAVLKQNGGMLRLFNKASVVNRSDVSVCQLGFDNDDNLIFAADGNSGDDPCDAGNFWNLYRWHRQSGTVDPITCDYAEYGEPHWLFGQNRWVVLDASRIAGIRSEKEGDIIVEIDTTTLKQKLLASGFVSCQHLYYSSYEETLYWIAHHADRGTEILSIDMQDASNKINLRKSEPIPLDPENVSRPQLIEYSTSDGAKAFAYYYQPCNPAFESAEEDLRPPLVVMVHGGPTSRTDSRFSLIKQYFTGLGFAIVDVNYRGSSGYGRQYRQSLLGNWGVIDADDIADAVQHLISNGMVDPGLVFIRGSSAGGYTVLRMLTRNPDLFAGGACYYGIGNLITMVSVTHKFESCYIDRLLGEEFDPNQAVLINSRYTKRSPIFKLDRLKSPLILFQGLEDKVVPPELSREVVEQLKKYGVKHAYKEYEGEGHGFKSAVTREDSLSCEIDFYQSLIKSALKSNEM